MRKAVKSGSVIFVLIGLAMFTFGVLLAQENSKISAPETKLNLIMNTYKGDTVIISGKIDYPDFKVGDQIRIDARSYPAKKIPPDIAVTYISWPGDYSLKVPVNIGNVTVGAVVIWRGENTPHKNGPKGRYNDGNPIKVENKDIPGINMTLKTIVD